MQGVSRLSPSQQREHAERWAQARSRFDELQEQPLSAAATFTEADDSLSKYFTETFPNDTLQALKVQFPTFKPSTVPIDKLICPLAVIDYEYVEELKATLTGTEPADILKFALPRATEVPLKMAQDPSGRAITFVSSQKTIALSAMLVNQVPGVGVEVRMLVSGNPQFIFVSLVGGRLFIRNGVHRAYLLASLGVKELPCLLVEEPQIPIVVGAYPTFTPQVLALPRPPLLIDAFDPTVALTMPVVRTTKIIRISGEELVLPVD
jgi:hypothetical protein